VGETVELPPDAARAMLADGRARMPGEPASAPAPTPTPPGVVESRDPAPQATRKGRR
jgi:hypothetical protein